MVRAWGGPGQGYRVARVEPRHHASTARATCGSAATARNDGHILKFTQGRQVRQAVRLRLRERRQQRPVGVQQGREGLRSTSRATRPTSPTATATSASPSSTWTPARSSATGAPTATSPTTPTLGRYNPDAPLAQQFRNPVHCAELSNDGFVYVCDRVERSHPGLHEGRQVREGESSSRRTRAATARCGTSPSRRTPQQKYFYLADGAQREDPRVRSRSRSTELTSFGDGGRQPGQFYAVHSIATDSKGNVYTTETYRGQRAAEVRLQGPRRR